MFWTLGYEGTSLQDLETATGLPKQTLYREFGSKQAMYLAALAAYERSEVSAAAREMDLHADPASAFAALFAMVLDGIEAEDDRRGCFLCNAAADRTGIDPLIDRHVREAMDRLRAVFTRHLGPHEDAGELGAVLLTGYVGIRILARTGIAMADLRAVAARLVALI